MEYIGLPLWLTYVETFIPGSDPCSRLSFSFVIR